ncbi:hypothetical protein O0L34_g5254 [Tuta absoluta]|nr:hypothetical protein O0L34_g5254 [Tuta absoluta]
MSDNKCDYSPLECDIIKTQIARRAKYREEFLKKRTDPCAHSKEAGYVFDENMQRFVSMKATQLDHFKPNKRTSFFGIFAIVLPMAVYGTLIYFQRSTREEQIRSGAIKYKDRLHKLI